MFKLQFVDKRQPAMWLVDDRLTIGRDKSNSLVVNDEGISVFHAELRREDNKLYLRDCGSVNGTFLNGTRVSDKVEVQAGDAFRLHLVEFEIVDPAKTVGEGGPRIKRDIEKPALPQWQVKAMTGAMAGRLFLVDGTKVIGRDPGCDIMVTGAHVSRRHAELSIRSGHLWMKDLGSSNGSFVNGKRVEEGQLKNGDEVKFDAMTFRIVGPAEAGEESFEGAEQTQFRAVIAPSAPVAPAPKPAAAPAPAPAPKPPVAPAPKPAAVSSTSTEPGQLAAAPAPTPAPAPVAAPKPAAPKPAPAPSSAPSAQAKAGGGGMNMSVIAVIALVVIAAIAVFFLSK
jgi:pSer/pThr/pTyr-binding forkhead associated (FHA) protein